MISRVHRLLESLFEGNRSVTLYTGGGHIFTGYPDNLTGDSVRLGSNGKGREPFTLVVLETVVAVKYV